MNSTLLLPMLLCLFFNHYQPSPSLSLVYFSSFIINHHPYHILSSSLLILPLFVYKFESIAIMGWVFPCFINHVWPPHYTKTMYIISLSVIQLYHFSPSCYPTLQFCNITSPSPHPSFYYALFQCHFFCIPLLRR